MKTLLAVNLTTKSAFSGDELWAPPVHTFGEEPTLALRFAETLAGATVEADLSITGLTASYGLEDARPESGEWALQIGPGPQTAGNTTGLLQNDCSPKDLVTAINAKAGVVAIYGAAVATKENGSWVLVFGTGAAQVPLRVVRNSLWPVSIGRVSAAPLDGVWQHELRHVQVPLAFTDTSEAVLPPEPAITRIRAGNSGGGFSYNERQRLYVPPDYRATYEIVSGFERSPILSNADTAETIQEALETMFEAGNVVVTNPVDFSFDIEFIGDLKGTTLAEMTVVSHDPPPGDLTFTLPLDKAPLLRRLAKERAVRAPLEVRLRTLDDDGVIRERVAFRTELTVQRPIYFPELAEVANGELLRLPSPKDYIPRSDSNVLVGQKYHPAVIGNGAATSFVVAHPLETDDVFVWVRENTSNGRQLVEGVDYEVRIVDDESVEVTALGDAPALNGWIAYVMSAQTIAAFAEGLEVSIGQVIDLNDRLLAIEDSLQELQDLAPATPLGTSIASTTPMVIEIDDLETQLPRAKGGRLLPAAHDAVIADAPVPLGSPATGLTSFVAAGNTNSGAIAIGATTFTLDTLPTQIGTGDVIRFTGHLHEFTVSNVVGTSVTFAPAAPVAIANTTAIQIRRSVGAVYRTSTGLFVASDGQGWYDVLRRDATNSYFAQAFEQELFFVEVSDEMLRAGTTLTLGFSVGLQMLKAKLRGRYRLVLQHGVATGDLAPATTAENLRAIEWNATPLLSQPLTIGANKVTHRFGAQIVRAANGSLTASKIVYNFATAALSTPTSANVALRGLLTDFDLENSAKGVRGTVISQLTDARLEIR